NIGGKSLSTGKRMITNAVAVDPNDLKAFLFLNEQRIELEIRKVAADSQVNLMYLLKKERSNENNAS
ncbi:PTS sugar transporter subunit IIB, partial [Enterococcus faecalis]|uniref:PTS sugar transporter subunit IIB n=1 Tax=Enterococcus faecalis TaxID=1351 RepID=UPI00113680DD